MKTSKSRRLHAGITAKTTRTNSHPRAQPRHKLTDADLYEPRGEIIKDEMATAEQLAEEAHAQKIKRDRARNQTLASENRRLQGAIFQPQSAKSGLLPTNNKVRVDVDIFDKG
jgi:hypothetical protein